MRLKPLHCTALDHDDTDLHLDLHLGLVLLFLLLALSVLQGAPAPAAAVLQRSCPQFRKSEQYLSIKLVCLSTPLPVPVSYINTESPGLAGITICC